MVAGKYLGTFIPKDLTKIQEFNYQPIIQKIIKTLQKYNRMAFSWIVRINIIKMDILSKLLYVFQYIFHLI